MKEGDYISRADSVARYDKLNTRQYAIKLNLGTDLDLIQYLDNLENKQAAIKTALRKLMQEDPATAPPAYDQEAFNNMLCPHCRKPLRILFRLSSE